jgi:hypothetical protein
MKKKEIDFKEIPWDKASNVSFFWWGKGYIMYLVIDNEEYKAINTPEALTKGIYRLIRDEAPQRMYR